ncbi:MAG: hypothetical protein AAFX06_00900 [Planctomycetota bacterium]
MRIGNRRCCCFVMFLLSATFASGQELKLQEVVDRFVASREAIRSYAVVVRSKVKQDLKPRLSTTGEEFLPVSELKGYEFEVLVDRERKSAILFAKVDRRGLNGNTKVTGPTSAIYVVTPDYEITASDGFGTIRAPTSSIDEMEYDFQSIPCFDPLTLGFAFDADISRGSPLKTIREHYQRWPELGPLKRLKSGLLRWGKEPQPIDYDPDRDYVPVRLRHTAGYPKLYAVDIKYQEINEHWLPKSATMSKPGQNESLEFKWTEVDENLAYLFGVESIRGRYDLQLIDRR